MLELCSASALQRSIFRLGALALLVLPVAAALATGPSKNLAPGFRELPAGATVLVAPLDVELFEIDAGGIPEPRADWTDTARRLIREELERRRVDLGVQTTELAEDATDELGEVLSLQGAVSEAIAAHQFGELPLPTKNGQLDWTFGDAMQPLQQKTGARYGLFIWVRDGYTSAARKATMALTAILSLGHVIPGGARQLAYASLVDLEGGRVLWFNRVVRGRGDLRDPAAAAETVDELLKNFPVGR